MLDPDMSDFQPGPLCDSDCTDQVCRFKWNYGNCRCLNCGFEQVSVWPGCAPSIQCGKCGSNMQVPNPLKPLEQ